MVGMNSGAFPREDRPLGFDLMAKDPRPGDRSRRDDDKYLFLEALVSARERFYISYTGQSVQDNEVLPPSVLVSELIDALREGYGAPPEALVTRHPLHAFSDAYFQQDRGLFSYSVENLRAAEALQAGKPPRPFFEDDIPLDESEAERWRTPTVDLLCEFFANPCRFLLRHRLSVRLETGTAAVENSEPFRLDALQSFLLGQELVGDLLEEKMPADRFALARARGKLPHGGPGEVDFRRVSAEARFFVEELNRLDIGPKLPPPPFRLDLRANSICGRIDHLHPGGICMVRFARMKSVDLLSGWIRHLVLCAVRSPEAPRATFLIFRDGAVCFGPAAEPQPLLEELLGFFRAGLSRPLHFFPATSETYARARQSGASTEEALDRARPKWRNEFGRSESDDPYCRWCFQDQDPLDEAFCKTAETVWAPLLRSIEPLSR
jgi:exodeoxyribonuclease V gamma subunit